MCGGQSAFTILDGRGGAGGKKLLDFLLPQGGTDTLDVLDGDINAPRQLVDQVAEIGATLVKCPSKLDFPLAPAPRQRTLFAIRELRGPHVLLAGLVLAVQPLSLELRCLHSVEGDEAVERLSYEQRFGILMHAEGRGGVCV